MSVRLRNVDADCSEPVAVWPFEAVLTVLDRGGLTQWRRIAQEIRADPWGTTARKVEQALDVLDSDGVVALMREVIGRARDEAAHAERMEIAQRIRAAIADSGLTRSEFALRIGTSASRLSTYASGTVTPSAAMLLRIERLAHAPQRPSTPAPPPSAGAAAPVPDGW